MLQNGVSHRCACVKLSTKVGGIAPSSGAANLPEKVSRGMGHRSRHSIASSRDLGPVRASKHPDKFVLFFGGLSSCCM